MKLPEAWFTVYPSHRNFDWWISIWALTEIPREDAICMASSRATLAADAFLAGARISRKAVRNQIGDAEALLFHPGL